MRSFNQSLEKILPSLCAFGLAFTCSACTTVSQTTPQNFTDSKPVQAIYTESTGSTASARPVKKNRPSENSPAAYAAPASDGSKVYRDSAFQQISYSPDEPQPGLLPPGQSRPAGSFRSVATTGHHPTHHQVGGQWAPQSCPPCPPDPRWPAAGPNPMAPGMMACDVVNLPSPANYSDEYLCDGGDRAVPVHYDSSSRLGLDTEDTILEFTDRAGQEKVKPSNRVCIYAPRFASVRTVSRPIEESGTNGVVGIDHLASTRGMHSRLKASNKNKGEMTGGIAVPSRAGGVESDAVQDHVSQVRNPLIHDKVVNLYQAMTFVKSGRMEDTDILRLQYGLTAALSWTRDQNPVITGKADMVLEGHFEQSSAVIKGIDEKEESENLRIVKLADKQTAVSGDIIEFTIRYDNLGGKEVHHIRIVDNLTPRLEYVDDSGTSDRAGRLVLQDNGEGSNVLVWELDDPLPGKTGGVVTFKARVR